MRKTYITATLIAVALAGWLLSGQLGKDDTRTPASLAEMQREQQRVQDDSAPTRVRVSVIRASEQNRYVKVRGKTENKRTVDVKVELEGRIVNRPVERGSVVAANDLLCELSVEDRTASLNEARESLNQARIEYQGALSLKERGFNSQTAIAGAKARLAAAQANLSRRQLDVQKIKVRAPFAGIVEDVQLEIGDFVTPGANCATIVDLDPMLLRGRVSEMDVVQLEVGVVAQGRLSNGNIVEGPVTFIGQQSDPGTRTYPIEIQLDNKSHTLRSGITTEILIPVENVLAQNISPALLSLDDAGGLGVRTVNAQNIVEFHSINILSDDRDGAWVTGLPNRAAVITVGQELVTAGERVDPIFQGSQNMPAQSPNSTAPAEAPVSQDEVEPHSTALPSAIGANVGAGVAAKVVRQP